MINLFSDTVTLPTDAMYDAIREAELGDDVISTDVTVNLLEAEAAELFGKEAALLVPSGTMANLVSAMTHGGQGDEMFVDPDAHVYHYEAGGLCAIAGYTPTFIKAERGRPDPDALKAAIRPKNIHFPTPRLLWIENTHNRGGGSVLDPGRQAALIEIARDHGLKVHVDGARIFNASVALGVPLAAMVRDVDTVSFCLSKGLSCPIGSLVAGPRGFIARARHVRKRLGGGMRQGGIVAASGRVALKTMIDRLADDHQNARNLAEKLAHIPGLGIEPERVETNMIFIDVTGWDMDAYEAARRVKEQGVLISEMSYTHARIVTQRHFSADQIPAVVEAYEKACPHS